MLCHTVLANWPLRSSQLPFSLNGLRGISVEALQPSDV